MHLIRFLSSNEENKLTVIEKKKDLCKEVSEKYDAVILNEDGSNPEVMKKAEASLADLMVVATDDDKVNIAATRHAKTDFGVPKVIAVAYSPKNKDRLRTAGADVIICPVDLALDDIENVLTPGRSRTLLYRSELDLKVSETSVPLNAYVIGKTIHELKIPEKCRISLVTRGHQYLFPDGDMELMSGDRVLVMGDGASVERTVELLKSAEPA